MLFFAFYWKEETRWKIMFPNIFLQLDTKWEIVLFCKQIFYGGTILLTLQAIACCLHCKCKTRIFCSRFQTTCVLFEIKEKNHNGFLWFFFTPLSGPRSVNSFMLKVIDLIYSIPWRLTRFFDHYVLSNFVIYK